MSGKLTPPVSDRDHIQGSNSAPVTLVEYGDFECPHCGHAYPILKRIKQRLGARLRFVFRHFPIADAHPHAEHAAEASESVATRGGAKAFWSMHDLIFEHQDALEDTDLAKYAAKAGVDGKAVLQDLDAGVYESAIRASFMSGVRSGVNGTPTLFINGVRYDGPVDDEVLLAELEAAAGAT